METRAKDEAPPLGGWAEAERAWGPPIVLGTLCDAHILAPGQAPYNGRSGQEFDRAIVYRTQNRV